MSFIGSTSSYPIVTPALADTVPLVQGNLQKQATVASIAASNAAVTVLATVAGVVTIDLSLGGYFTLALSANVTSILFTNLPGSGRGASVFVRITQDSTPRTVAMPASFRWEGSTPVVSTGSGAIDVLALTTFDNGTKWDATLSKGRA